MAARSQIRIRMYRIGFGESFLLTFFGPPEKHVLVDCGVHSQGDIGTLDEVVADIEGTTGGKLAIVIASHAHQDHISGFDHHGETFGRFEIGEIWLPWTEKPGDQDAARLRRRNAALVAALRSQFAAKPPTAEAAAAFVNIAARSNTSALKNLRSGFGTSAEVHYLEGPDEIRDAGGIAGLDVRLLGPPRDEAFLKKMYMPVPERYLRARAGAPPDIVNEVVPFADDHVETGDLAPRLDEAETERLREALAVPFDALSFVLEEGINNTSVVALLSFGGRHLLFPGDAQYGSWKFWTEDLAADVLSTVDFYKVSHHGSWNATPRSVLERMTSPELAMMVSTQQEPWKSIPDRRLMKALKAQSSGRVARSDSLVVSGAPTGPEVRRAPHGFRTGLLWYDHWIDL